MQLPRTPAFIGNMMKYFRKQDFPILSLDQDLVYIYWQSYRNSSFTEEMNDEGLLQLPYATSLYITRSMCEFAQAAKAFEQATSIFRTVSSGWDELSIEDQQELTLISWELSKFLELDKLGFDPPLLNACDLRTATQAFLSGL
ncbi:hypothetical protein FOFC_18306 [Fusarium oxysporum]|nr:hypothetical protein FOFC_18306 [Fusarium oxysporum]